MLSSGAPSKDANGQLGSASVRQRPPSSYHAISSLPSLRSANPMNGRAPSWQTLCCLPHRWSLSFLIGMTLAVASLTSLLINAFAVLYLSSSSSNKTMTSSRTHSLQDPVSWSIPPQTTGSTTHQSVPPTPSSWLRQGNKFTPLDHFSGKRTVVVPRVWMDSLDWPVATPTSSSRTVFFDNDHVRSNVTLVPNQLLAKDETSNDNNDNSKADRCVPMAAWQEASFPNCNVFHELNLPLAAGMVASDIEDQEEEDTEGDKKGSEDDDGEEGVGMGDTNITGITEDFVNGQETEETPKDVKERSHEDEQVEEDLTVLGEGWFRTTWKLRRNPPERDNKDNEPELTVLKTLRIEREFIPEYYELHRRDAVAMERLSWSEFVVDVYGYCGQSAINEMANFQFDEYRELEKFDRRMRFTETVKADNGTSISQEKIPPAPVMKIKLQMAASIAQGVADIHSIDGYERATMVHYDLNPRNIAIFRNGRPKLNDFNIAEFLRYDPSTNRTCGFRNRMHQPWWRAPEEVDENTHTELNEKVDIYSLGTILHHILTTHAPYGKMKPEFIDDVRKQVLAGIPPVLPPPFAYDTNIVTASFKKAMARCFVKDPNQRATAHEILDILVDGVKELIAQGKHK